VWGKAQGAGAGAGQQGFFFLFLGRFFVGDGLRVVGDVCLHAALIYVVLPVLQMDLVAGWVLEVDRMFHVDHPCRQVWDVVRPIVLTEPTRPSTEDMKVHAGFWELTSDLEPGIKAVYINSFARQAGVGTPYACPGSWFDRAIPHSRLRA
jgi:hypothetical protein